jgi:hypothetical protein
MNAEKRIRRQEEKRDKMCEYRGKIHKTETDTGIITFPDNDLCSIQIVLTNGQMRVDIPNALDDCKDPSTLQWQVVRFVDIGSGSKLVEFER